MIRRLHVVVAAAAIATLIVGAGATRWFHERRSDADDLESTAEIPGVRPLVTATTGPAAAAPGSAVKRAPTIGSPETYELLRRRGEEVSKQLRDVDDWFRRQPALASFDAEIARRRERSQHWATRLGLVVTGIECRQGACRLEVAPDPAAQRHTALRPLPRVEETGSGLLFRLPGDDGPVTVVYTATDGAQLPSVKKRVNGG